MLQAESPLSIADLEPILEEKKSQVLKLIKKRDRAQNELDKLDAEIQGELNLDRPIRAVRRHLQRQKNESSLRTVVLGVLGNNKKGLTLTDLTAKVADTGYKSNAGNFKKGASPKAATHPVSENTVGDYSRQNVGREHSVEWQRDKSNQNVIRRYPQVPKE